MDEAESKDPRPEERMSPDGSSSVDPGEGTNPTETVGLEATSPDSITGMVRGRFALLIVLLMILLADITIYHAHGYSGPAAFFMGAVALLIAGIPKRAVTATSLLIALMMLLLSFRLTSNGWWLQVVVGLWLLHALTLCFRRQQPFILETLIFAAQMLPGGYDFYRRINERMKEKVLSPAEDGTSG